MKIIRDSAQVQRCFEQHHVEQYFELPPSAFHLRSYEKGELLCSPMKRLEDLLILLEGKIYLYGLNQQGRQIPISAGSGYVLLGDMEFATGTETPFYAQAQSRVLCLALSMERNRAALHEDRTFLHLLIQSLAQKILFQSAIELPSATIEERVLRYLNTTEGHRMEGIESTALLLRCSKRQLLRTLKKLCQEGKTERIGHRLYRLRSGDGEKSM